MNHRILISALGFTAALIPFTTRSAPSAPVAPATTATPTTETRAIPATPPAPIPMQTVSMTLRWNDAGGGFRIPVQNTSDQPLHIDAVQSSGDLFVASFPATVPPRGSSDIVAVLDAKPNTDSDGDVVRLKTNQGDKTILVTHNREKVVSFDAQSVTWVQGEALNTKSVTLRITGAVTQLTKARAFGGASATIDDLGGGAFRVNVTPRSTAAARSFPVLLEFSPALPGATPMISCAIIGAN